MTPRSPEEYPNQPFFVKAWLPGSPRKAEISCQDAASALKRARAFFEQDATDISIHDADGHCLEGATLEAIVFAERRGAIEGALTRFYFAFVEPVFIAARKRRRMKSCGVGSFDQLAIAEIDLQPGAAGSLPVCEEIVAAHRRYLAKYAFAGNGRPLSWRWRGVALLIDLARYPDFDAYANRLKKHSKGAAMRQVHKARRIGFYCKPFDRRHHRLDLHGIETSKRFRSGPVLAAFLRRKPRAVRPSAAPAPDPPPCLHHWYADWGVFAAGADGERLFGYLYLKRIGKTARVTALLGHGDHLAEGIIKFLFIEVMKWLLDRRDPQVRGIRYLHYGAIEHGNTGLAAWKHRFCFEPFVFCYRKATATAIGAQRSGGSLIEVPHEIRAA